MEFVKACIEQGKTALGIELGSTRIKAVLIDERHAPIASGSFEWENRYEDGIWTYHLDEVWAGLQESYRRLAQQVRAEYAVELQTIGSIGFSAMMHGYLPLDEAGEALVPFRTWRNTTTAPAAEELTELFWFNIPQRWSIAHLYQAILDGEPHVAKISYLTTLAGYVHWKLTGEKVLGVGEASGMFPIDSEKIDYNEHMMGQFDAHIAFRGFPWKLREILPRVLCAGEAAGTLTAAGAQLLDPTGALRPGIPLCPPEGDAGTGMAATNSVAARTGNVSAGTSVFAMVVLERALSKVYPEIDMVTTPSGKPVAMVHCNNCTNEINAWAGLFREVSLALGAQDDKNRLFEMLFGIALEGEADCGGLMAYNYLSGEPVTGFESGCPLFVRTPESRFTLANFMRAQLYSAVATLKIGMDILRQEHVKIDRLLGHGGFFKTPQAGQRVMAAAMGASVSVMETAGEGGAWGCALLAAYMRCRAAGQTLESYLQENVFGGDTGTIVEPQAADAAGFAVFMERYRHGLAAEQAAVDALGKGG